MKIQRAIEMIMEKHQFNPTQSNEDLKLSLGGDSWIVISVNRLGELVIARYRKTAHDTLIADPGAVFNIENEEWLPVEIIQDMSDKQVLPSDNTEPYESPGYMPLRNDAEVTSFLNLWADILLNRWLLDAHSLDDETGGTRK